jgi:hypothetical protein
MDLKKTVDASDQPEILATVQFYFNEMGLDDQGEVTDKITDKDKTLRALEATKKILSKQNLSENEINQLKSDNTWNGGVEEISKIIKQPLKLQSVTIDKDALKKYLLELTNEKIDSIKPLQTKESSSFFTDLFAPKKPTPDQIYDSLLQSNKEQLDRSFAFFKKDYDLLCKFPDANSHKITNEKTLRQEFDKRVKEFVTIPSKPNQIFIWEAKNGQEGDPLNISFDSISTSSVRGGIFLRNAREKFLEENITNSNLLPSLPSLPSFDLEKIFKPQQPIEDVFKSISKFLPPFSQPPKVDFLSQTTQSLQKLITFSAPKKIEVISFTAPRPDNIWEGIKSLSDSVAKGFNFNSSSPAPQKTEVSSTTTREFDAMQRVNSSINKAKNSANRARKSSQEALDNATKVKASLKSRHDDPNAPIRNNPIPSSSPSSPKNLVRNRIAYFGDSPDLLKHAKKTTDKKRFIPILSPSQQRKLTDTNNQVR